MRRLVVIPAVFVACAAVAQGRPENMVFTSGRVQIRLLQDECKVPYVVAMLTAGGALTPAKAATVTKGAKEIQGCWALDADHDVLIGDETGSQGYVPMSAFQPAAASRRGWV